MSRNSIIMAALLTVIWMVMRESFSVSTAATGLVVGSCCVLLSRRLIPLPSTERVKSLRLIPYMFFLLAQIYIGSISAVKAVFCGAGVEIVELKTEITNKVLRTILVNSITLVPGSVTLGLKDDSITVLWLISKSKKPVDLSEADEMLKNKLERRLLKAEK